MPRPETALRIASIAEIVTLAILLTNLFTIHARPISSSMGMIHGCTYLLVICCVLLIERTPIRIKALAWIPIVGGILAVRALARARDDAA